MLAKYFRPAEVSTLLGDSSSKKRFGWKPQVKIDELIAEMMHSDLEYAKSGVYLIHLIVNEQICTNYWGRWSGCLFYLQIY